MRLPDLLRPAAVALLGAGRGEDAAYVAKRRAVALQCLRPAVRLRWHKAAQLEELRARLAVARDVVIYLPTLHWGYLQQRPHQILRELGRRGWLSIFCTSHAAADRVDGFREVEPNVLLCSDPRLLLGMDRPVLWLNWTVNGAFLPFFRRPRVVYEWIDELEVFGFHCPRMHADHAGLLRTADVVVASADRLLAAARGIRPATVLAPNGVAPGDFVLAPDTPVPADLARVRAAGRPVVGYYGALARWVDWELLDRVAAAAPDLSFVLIGPDHDGSAHRIPRRDNVFVLGEKPYAELPGYSRRFDVAIIPFVVSEVTRSTSPVKLFEYLAAGAPVVTTSMDECRKYGSVAIADGPEAFLAAVRAALGRRDDPAWRALAAREVRENT
jgi:glycosyltransferase involved in cell wall biosynthesis